MPYRHHDSRTAGTDPARPFRTLSSWVRIHATTGITPSPPPTGILPHSIIRRHPPPRYHSPVPPPIEPKSRSLVQYDSTPRPVTPYHEERYRYAGETLGRMDDWKYAGYYDYGYDAGLLRSPHLGRAHGTSRIQSFTLKTFISELISVCPTFCRDPQSS